MREGSHQSASHPLPPGERVAAVVLSRIVERRARRETQERWLGRRLRFEWWERWPTRQLTGNFVAAKAVRREVTPA